MSFKDTMEIGLKPDAAYRPENLPESELAERRRRKASASRGRKRTVTTDLRSKKTAAAKVKPLKRR